MKPYNVDEYRNRGLAGDSWLSVLSGILLFLSVFSGRFSLERIGAGDLEVRYFFVGISVLIIPLIRRRFLLHSGGGGVWLAFFFLIGVTVSAFYNMSGNLVVDKMIDVFLIFLLSALSFFTFSGDQLARRAFLFSFASLGLLYALVSIGTVMVSSTRGDIGIGGPNVATRIMFLGGLSLFYLSICGVWKKGVFLMPVYLAGIIGIGSRGGMGGAAAAIVIGIIMAAWHSRLGFLKSRQAMSRFLRYMVPAALLFLIGGWLVFPVVAGVFENRFLNLVVDHVHYAGRDTIYLESIETIKSNPYFGLGLGGYTEIGIPNYPHNLVLELMLDGGIMLGAFFVAFILLSIKYLVWCKGKYFIISISLLYMILVQQLSGDYYDFRYYFVFLILVQAIHNERGFRKDEV